MNGARATFGTRSGDILLVSFLATVTMLFAGFTAALLIRRTGADWQLVALPRVVWFNTGLLVASSMTVELACRRSSRGWLLATLLLGLSFLAGQLLAWRQLAAAGIDLSTTPLGSFFYMLSAVHGLHLLGGLGGLLWVVGRGAGTRLVAIYWHFVGVVWLYVLTLLVIS